MLVLVQQDRGGGRQVGEEGGHGGLASGRGPQGGGGSPGSAGGEAGGGEEALGEEVCHAGGSLRQSLQARQEREGGRGVQGVQTPLGQAQLLEVGGEERGGGQAGEEEGGQGEHATSGLLEGAGEQ